jgi:hypothetical protein
MVSATPRSDNPQERHGTRCTVSLVGSRASLDGCGKSRPNGIRSADCSACSKSLYRLSYSGPKSRIVTPVFGITLMCKCEQSYDTLYRLDTHSAVHKTQPHLPRPSELHSSSLLAVIQQTLRISLLTDTF